jgi:adenylate cyclase
VFLLIVLKTPLVVERLNNAVSAIQIRLLPSLPLSALPVIVEVDEKSLANYGQWPWPRYLVARLLAILKESDAAAVGIDALFLEKDRTSPLVIQQALAQDLHQNLPLASINPSFWDYDAILGDTLKTGPFIVSYYFTFDDTGLPPCQPKSASGALLSGDSQKSSTTSIIRATQIACNVSPIQSGANASGFINSASDNDGIYRKTPLIMEYKGRLYPSLALQTFLTFKSLDHFLVSSNFDGLVLHAGNVSTPLDRTGNLLIKFPVHEKFERISANDLLSGTIDTTRIKGKIIFLGFSASGLHEVRPTPYNPDFLGVEFHAAIVDNLLRQDFLHRPDSAPFFEAFIAAILGLGLLMRLVRTGPVEIIVLPSLLIISLLITTQLLLAYKGMVLSPALPVVMISLTVMAAALIKYSREYLHAKRMTQLVSLTQEGIIGSICSMSEYRDPDTGAHLKRTQEYIKALAMHLQHHPKFKAELSDEAIDLLFKAAPLHDIGKIGIRDNVLLKPGRLDQDEFEIMKAHPQIGAKIIESVATQIGWNSFMLTAHQICLCHQEKWDGSGYPKGIRGEEIPISARLMALADVYDALISKRIYKPAFSHILAVGLIREGKNTHFDPHIVEAFEAIQEQFQEIASRFVDEDQ